MRAVTRHPDSDRARELERAGAEVVRADMDDEASLAPAFEGAYGAFPEPWASGAYRRQRTAMKAYVSATSVIPSSRG